MLWLTNLLTLLETVIDVNVRKKREVSRSVPVVAISVGYSVSEDSVVCDLLQRFFDPGVGNPLLYHRLAVV